MSHSNDLENPKNQARDNENMRLDPYWNDHEFQKFPQKIKQLDMLSLGV